MPLVDLATKRRRAKRDQYREYALLAADARDRSLKCRWSKHSNTEGGCEAVEMMPDR